MNKGTYRKFFIFICVFLCTIDISSFKVYGRSLDDASFTKVNTSEIKISEKEIKNENRLVRVHLRIPVVSGLTDKTAENEINNTFLSDAIRFKASMEKQAEESYQSSKINSIAYNKYDIETTYSVKYNKNNLLSIPVIYYQYTGGAHGISTQAGYNFDLETGKLLQLSDLFPKGFDYKKVIDEIILNYMKANKDKYFSEAINLFQGIDGMHPYYIQDKNLVVFFSEYEIAPYSEGIQEFGIPYSKLKFIKKYELKLK